MGIVVQRKGRHEKVGFVEDWRVDVFVAERNMTKMVRNREWDHLHAEDTSQKLTIILTIIPPAAPRSITIFSAQFKKVVQGAESLRVESR